MKVMKKGELKVFYEGELNQPLDIALQRILGGFGYERRASGMSAKDVRDLAFDKTKKQKKGY